MTDTDQFAEIRHVLDGYNAALELKQKEEAEFNQFTAEFTAVVKSIIEPAMNEIKDYAKKKGHNCSINFDPKGERTLDGKSFPLIEFSITPPRRPNHWVFKGGDPRLSIYVTVTKTVAITKRTMTILDPSDGTTEFGYKLPEITKDLVKTKIIELFNESYGENWKDYF